VRGIRRALKLAYKNATHEIRQNSRGGAFSAGLSAEGYAGGCRDALLDVESAINGFTPNNSRFWPSPKPLTPASNRAERSNP
jgi:hypothetical protein